MEGATGRLRSDAHVQCVGASSGYVDCVAQPLAWCCKTHVKTAADIGGPFNAHPLRYPVLPTLVESTFIIVSNTLTTIIEIFRLNLTGNNGRCAMEWGGLPYNHWLHVNPVKVTHTAPVSFAIEYNLHRVFSSLKTNGA